MGDSIVIMERGSRWPAWVDRQAGAESNVLVLSQQQDEGLFEFHSRVLDQLCSIAIAGQARRAVLVSSALFGADEAESRRDLLMALAMLVSGAGSGQVVLVADGGSASRFELASLAGELNLELDARDIAASIMLRAAPRQASVPAPAPLLEKERRVA